MLIFLENGNWWKFHLTTVQLFFLSFTIKKYRIYRKLVLRKNLYFSLFILFSPTVLKTNDNFLLLQNIFPIHYSYQKICWSGKTKHFYCPKRWWRTKKNRHYCKINIINTPFRIQKKVMVAIPAYPSVSLRPCLCK